METVEIYVTGSGQGLFGMTQRILTVKCFTDFLSSSQGKSSELDSFYYHHRS